MYVKLQGDKHYAVLTLDKKQKCMSALNVKKKKIYPTMSNNSHWRQREYFGISHFYILFW